MTTPLIPLWTVLVVMNGEPFSQNRLYENYIDCGSAGVGYAKTHDIYNQVEIYCKDVNSDRVIDMKAFFDKENKEWLEKNRPISDEEKDRICLAAGKYDQPCFEDYIKRERVRVKNDPNATWWDKFITAE